MEKFMIQLTTREIACLAEKFQDHNLLSPFHIKEEMGVAEVESLARKGITSGGAIAPAAMEILTDLAQPECLSCVVLLTGYATVKLFTYKKNGGVYLAEHVGDDELQFSRPENWDRSLQKCSEFLGVSTLLNVRIKVVLSAREVLVLSAIIDLYRKNALAGYIDLDEPSGSLSLDAIKSEIAVGYSNGLRRLLEANFDLDAPDPDEIDPALEGLRAKACLDKNSSGYALTPAYALFARNFLMPCAQVLLETFRLLDGGKVASGRYLAIASGMHDILGLSFDGENFEVETISAYYLLRMIEDYLGGPELVGLVSRREVDGVAQQATTPPSGMDNDDPEQVQWYLGRQGQQYGPYSFAALRVYAREGRVHGEDLIRRSDSNEWRRAGETEGLFAP